MACKDGKHKFQPRYDEVYSSVIEELSKIGDLSFNNMPWQSGERGIKSRTYVHDVCVKCGEIVKRSQ